MKKFLALFRAGDSSLHPYLVERLDQQNFDYALSWFGAGDPPPLTHAPVFVHEQTGAKWPGLAATLKEYAEVVSHYDYVWLPDDDLMGTPEGVSEFFAVCSDLALDLAQPALTSDSHFSHVTSLVHRGFQVRFTNFVEVMAPVLSRDMLTRVLPTLDHAVTGWGLDSIWPTFTTMGRVAIVDSTPVRHTRPIGGPNYAAAGGRSAELEAVLALARYGFDRPADIQITYGGLLSDGAAICFGAAQQDADAMLGALLSAAVALPVSPLGLTSYLSMHLDFWRNGATSVERFGGHSFHRDAIAAVLNEAVGHTGIRFTATGLDEKPAGRPGRSTTTGS